MNNLIGKIIKISSNKTASVMVKRILKIKKYKKSIKKNKKYLVHYENIFLKKGMIVLINYYKKISKLKSWKIKKIIK